MNKRKPLTISDAYYTKVETNSMDKYLHDINNYDLLERSEEKLLISKLLGETELEDNESKTTIREKLCNSNLRFCISIAKQFQGQGLSLEDLINEANIGLCTAIDKFKSGHDVKLISYAVWWITQCITSAIAEKGRNVRLPSNRINNMRLVQKAVECLRQTLHREPSSADITEYLLENNYDLTENDVKSATSHYKNNSYLEEKASDDSDATILDTLETDDHFYTNNNFYHSDRNIKINSYISSLDEKEGIVIKKLFGILGEEETNIDDIAVELKFKSSERVRQIKEQALEKLKKVGFSLS